MNAEPTQRIIPLGALVQCTDGYGGSATRLIVEPPTRRLTHIVVQGGTARQASNISCRLCRWLRRRTTA